MNIALCDDESSQLKQTEELLRSYYTKYPNIDLTINAFSYGAPLLEHLRVKGVFDIYLLDMLMPEEHGIDLGIHIRHYDRRPNPASVPAAARRSYQPLVRFPIDYAVGGGGVLTLIIRVVAYPLLEFAVYKWLRKPFLQIGQSFSKGWTLFAMLTGTCYVIMAIVSIYPTIIYQRPNDIPMAITLLFLVALTYTTIFIVLYQQNELFKIRELQHTFELQTDMMEKRVNELREAENRFRFERHNMRHHLLAISSMLQQNDTQAALDYIGLSQQALDSTSVKRYCANPTIDAILGSYFRQAEELNVQLETHIDLPTELPVPAAELSTVFANALENMINAMRDLPPEQRQMVCTCISYPCLMLEFANPCGREVVLGADGFPLANGIDHGVGTRYIAAFAEKYQAVCTFQIEDGWFRLRLAF